MKQAIQKAIDRRDELQAKREDVRGERENHIEDVYYKAGLEPPENL